jgi:DNA helicase-2/ATP-dependent DNA helicase PcrA
MALQSREELEEERRLFYVAITRAESRLSLSYASTRYRWGNLISCEPSRFIDEIDQKYIRDLTAAVSRPATADIRKSWNNFGSAKNIKEPVPSYKTRTEGFKKLSSSAGTASKSQPVSEVPFEADAAIDIREGMDVEHQKFGTGKVVRLEGEFPELRATVNFPVHGNKQLLLKFAKLRIIK